MLAPGIYRNLDMDAYHADPAVSKSTLTKFNKLPASILYRADTDNDTLRLGRAFHLACLEPRLFRVGVVPYDGIRRGKFWDEFQSKYEGKMILTRDQYDSVFAMSESLKDYKIWNELLEDGQVEVSIFWDDKRGFRIKSRPDLITSNGIMADPKTCHDLTDRGISKAILSYQYHWQAYLCMIGMEEHGQFYDQFIFVFISKAPYGDNKHGVRFVQIERGDEWWTMAEADLSRVLDDYKKCLDRNEFPAYPGTIETIPPPAWAVPNDEPLTMDGVELF